jgi:hypothetical protein
MFSFYSISKGLCSEKDLTPTLYYSLYIVYERFYSLNQLISHNQCVHSQHQSNHHEENIRKLMEYYQPISLFLCLQSECFLYSAAKPENFVNESLSLHQIKQETFILIQICEPIF